MLIISINMEQNIKIVIIHPISSTPKQISFISRFTGGNYLLSIHSKPPLSVTTEKYCPILITAAIVSSQTNIEPVLRKMPKLSMKPEY